MTRTKLLALQLGVGFLFLLIWHVLTVYPILGQPRQIQFFFSTPLDVIARVVRLFASGEIWFHLWITLVETVLAFVTGAAGGILFGFLFARRELLAAVFDPYIKAANACPAWCWRPIFALWFGLGIWSKVALGFTLVFFIVFFNVYQGVREVSPTVLANARMLGMNERQLLRHVYWPAALTWCSPRCTPPSASRSWARWSASTSAPPRARLQDPRGRERVRRDRRVRRHGDPDGLRDRHRRLVTVVEKRLLVWRPGPGGVGAGLAIRAGRAISSPQQDRTGGNGCARRSLRSP
jgi:ABC-type nitrate/sulfonate/bicarbonate transport system permease component